MSYGIPAPDTDSTEQDPNQSAKQLRGIIAPVHEKNTTEGGEFLDDAIRIKDQPFKYNEAKLQTEDPRSLF